MSEDFARKVYNTLNGYYEPALRIPGVENAFGTGELCLELYGQALDAYLRICERLGVGEDDADVEVIFNSFLEMSEILGLRMYHYGVIFGEELTTTPQAEIKDFCQLPSQGEPRPLHGKEIEY